MGIGGDNVSYELTNIALIIAGVVVALIGAWVLIEGWNSSHESAKTVAVGTQENASAVKEEQNAEVVTRSEPPAPQKESISEDDYLVLRLLNGDEREMYRSIVDAGGAMLQKDLIVKLKWSDAKVSRTIDKLIEKRVVSKERSGSTNRIKIDLTYDRE